MNVKTFAKQSPMSFLLIIGIVGYFVLQFLMGVNIDNPSGQDLLKFGANFLPKTINEPHRLLTAGFVHIGIMHLLFNAFALYYLSPIAEKLFGKLPFLILFLLSVIGGNILNLYWNWFEFLKNPAPFSLAAGASGGVMGINASLLVASLHSVFGKFLNTKSLLFMLAMNIFIGFAISGIDNAGHIGGAIMGGLLALFMAFCYKFYKIFWVILVVVLIGAFYYLRMQVLAYL